MSSRTEQIMAGLKDFQRDTVEYAFGRLWTDPDPVRRFLVADEVGLGKTMVAKGVITKTVDHLRDSNKRIDIVYICSNSQIARQNLSRLNVVGASEHRHADRLTLLPEVIRDLRQQRVNVVSFTPGTSFQVGSSGGKRQERVLLYWMLAAAWGSRITASVRWLKFFEGGVRRDRFAAALKRFDRSKLDPDLCSSFAAAVESASGPDGGPLPEELEDCAARFTYLRGTPRVDLDRRRYELIGILRQLLAHASVDHLEPDLVILDEFQRFKDLLDPEADDEGSRLASAILDHEDARVLMLSATPYKMYTLPDEPEGDDHYADFIHTVTALAGSDRARRIERDLRLLRHSLLDGTAGATARQARQAVEQELRRVMCRTERVAATSDQGGDMITERDPSEVSLTAPDVRGWLTFDAVARLLSRQDVFEYWRSSPYPLNLMEPRNYQIRARFQDAIDIGHPELTRVLRSAGGLLTWRDVRAYRPVDPGNAKLRGLLHDVVDRGSWRLAWLPPSVPYYTLDGAYAEPGLRHFTKRLLFSAWSVVPKAIAALVSYEVERRTVRADGQPRRRYDGRPPTPPLQFRMDGDRPANMPALAIFHPNVTLAELGDPLEIARSIGAQVPVTRERLLAVVRRRISPLISDLAVSSTDGPPDPRWYWAAPLLLDRSHPSGLDRLRRLAAAAQVQDHQSGFTAHIATAEAATDLELGAMPDDLVDLIATMAIAAPGVVALRALTRVCGGPEAIDTPELSQHSATVSSGLRTLFNKPEIVALIRSSEDEAYWRAVLDHAMDGGLQAVLDEYAHVLVESEGLQETAPLDRADAVATKMSDALSIRTAQNLVGDVRVARDQVLLQEHRINSHFAARYGRALSDEQATEREATIRTAFNSPFRPFVLASTSVGQEGLDFHSYSHAIVHWNLPANPVDLEQREGRVHRYKGHAIRKNVGMMYGAALHSDDPDPWESLFAAAVADRDPGASDLIPFWVFAPDGGSTIERYVPAVPLSREIQQYERLRRTVGAYRMVIGQPRQDDLLRYLGDEADLSSMRIDLTPPGTPDNDGSSAS